MFRIVGRGIAGLAMRQRNAFGCTASADDRLFHAQRLKHAVLVPRPPATGAS